MSKKQHEELRVMSVAEAAAVEAAWNLSPEKAALDARRKILIEKIAEKTAAYSMRC